MRLVRGTFGWRVTSTLSEPRRLLIEVSNARESSQESPVVDASVEYETRPRTHHRRRASVPSPGLVSGLGADSHSISASKETSLSDCDS
jgi:hypothetical protein